MLLKEIKQNEGFRKQHIAVREKVGYYNFTHQLLEVKGKDAADFLDWIYVNSIKKTGIGKAKYSTMLNENGEIIDDVIVFRMGEENFRISTLFIDDLIKWLDAHKGEYEVEYKDITPVTAMYAVQGPNAKELLNRILEEPVDEINFFNIKDNMIEDIPVKIARSGFTGELGYEVYIDPAKNDKLEKLFEEKGEDLGVMNITEFNNVIIGSLPAEKGYVLMTDIGGANPYEVGFGWTVAIKSDFIGKEKTLKVKENGGNIQLLGIEFADDVEMNTDDKVVVDGKEVGKVTKVAYGYTIEKAIGYIRVNNDVKIGDDAFVGESKIPVKVVDRIWYDPENLRVRG